MFNKKVSEETKNLISETSKLIAESEEKYTTIKERLEEINSKLWQTDQLSIEERREVFETNIRPLFKSRSYYTQCLPKELKKWTWSKPEEKKVQKFVCKPAVISTWLKEESQKLVGSTSDYDAGYFQALQDIKNKLFGIPTLPLEQWQKVAAS